MNPLFSFTCLSIIFSFTVFADKESLVSFLPDDTFFVLEVDNWGKLKDDLQDGPWGEIEKFPVWGKISGMIESELQRGKNKKFKSNFTEAKETVLDPLLDSVKGSMVLGVSDFMDRFSLLKHYSDRIIVTILDHWSFRSGGWRTKMKIFH